jgi:branched-chain amino acid transport system permease protein
MVFSLRKRDNMGLLSFYFKKIIKIFRSEVLVLPSRVAILVFIIVILVYPYILTNSYYWNVIKLACIFAILAASWDLLTGFTGQMNFGHALFFGVGAYGSALLNLHFQLPPIVTIPLGAVIAVLSGLIVGIPCLRLKGTYLALTTLAFPIILMGLVFAFTDFTKGEYGISTVGLADSKFVEYYVIVITMLVLVFIMWKITDSNIGIIFHAIREDEIAVRASGVNTTKYKLMAFCLSGFFAGIAGGLFAHYMKNAGPIATLSVNVSFTIVIYAIFGGIATIYGPVGAVFVLMPLLEALQSIPVLRMFVFATVVLLTLLFMPDGLFPWIRDKVETECPRCKVRNISRRQTCRICTTDLH